MKLLFKPFAILAGFIAARLGRSVFRNIWSSVDEEPPPAPRTGRGSMAKTVGGQALQGAVMAGVTATVERLFARFFHHLTGGWPEKPPEPEKE